MKYFKVINWEKFQHYKDRNPPWVKLYNSLIDKYEWGQLSDAGKGHYCAILLLASRYDNQIIADPDWVKSRIQAKNKVNLDELQTLGFIDMEQDASKLEADRLSREETEKRKEEERRLRDEGFDSFWEAYQKKVDKPAAQRAWAKVKPDEFQTVLDGATSYVNSRNGEDKQFQANPATWLNGRRWEDEIETDEPRTWEKSA